MALSMVWIETEGVAETFVRAPTAAVRRLILDVPRSGPFFPRVATIQDRGDGVYRWLLEPRRTLGAEFIGDYVTRYDSDSPHSVRWETVEGNLQVKGRWLLTEVPGGVNVRVEVTTGLDAPVPRLLKAPAVVFAQLETRQGLTAQLARLKTELESRAADRPAPKP